MKVAITICVDETKRKAISNHYGEPGLADRKTVADAARTVVDAWLEDLVFDLNCETPEEENAE